MKLKQSPVRESSLNEGHNNEKGIVLIITLALLAIIAMVATVVFNTTNTDIKISTNYKTSTQAFYAAEAGTEEVRARLKGTSTAANYIGDTSVPPNGSWSAYILTPGAGTSTDPNYDPTYTNSVEDSLQTAISYLVKVKHKREFDAISGTFIDDSSSDDDIIFYGYLDPSQPTTLVQLSTSSATIFHPVEIITAFGSSSSSLKNIEIEVVRNPGPPIIAAIYSEGDINISGNSGDFNGNDACGEGSPVGTIYVLDPGTTTGGTPTFTPTDPASGTDDIDIESYINDLKSDATTITNKNANDITGAEWGVSNNFVELYADTSVFNPQTLTISNETGYGVLMVEGDLVLGGGFNWNGLILVTGIITLNGGGGGGININGAVLANQTVTLNGSLNINYDSCMIDEALNNQSLSIINWKQIY